MVERMQQICCVCGEWVVLFVEKFKRDANGEAVEQPSFGVHAALREQVRLGDLYAAAASPGACLNVRYAVFQFLPLFLTCTVDGQGRQERVCFL
jgi:gamma-glutamylcysteine synthetase